LNQTDAERDRGKRAAAEAALEHLEPGSVVGVGTGSTADHFIDLLATVRERFAGAVASSARSAERLRVAGVPLFEMANVEAIPVYVDGADESDGRLRLIKGGGGALTREKILAAAARTFVCIADEHKLVARLGGFPLPVEIVPAARGYVSRRLRELGGRPVPRAGFVTDNGNEILDVRGLDLSEPEEVERWIDGIAGVVCNGLFARRPADLLLLGGRDGVRTLTR